MSQAPCHIVLSAHRVDAAALDAHVPPEASGDWPGSLTFRLPDTCSVIPECVDHHRWLDAPEHPRDVHDGLLRHAAYLRRAAGRILLDLRRELFKVLALLLHGFSCRRDFSLISTCMTPLRKAMVRTPRAVARRCSRNPPAPAALGFDDDELRPGLDPVFQVRGRGRGCASVHVGADAEQELRPSRTLRLYWSSRPAPKLVSSPATVGACQTRAQWSMLFVLKDHAEELLLTVGIFIETARAAYSSHRVRGRASASPPSVGMRRGRAPRPRMPSRKRIVRPLLLALCARG